MTEEKQASFKLHKIFFPKIDGSFVKTPNTDVYQQAIRVAVNVIGNNKILLLFGISLTSEEKMQGRSVAGVIAEVASEIELSEELKKDIKSLKDIPLSANMLALLFPFLREKVNYFFFNNHINIILYPINTIKLVEDLNDKNGLTITDERNLQTSTAAKSAEPIS